MELTLCFLAINLSGESIALLRSEVKSQEKHVEALKKRSLWSRNLEEVLFILQLFNLQRDQYSEEPVTFSSCCRRNSITKDECEVDLGPGIFRTSSPRPSFVSVTMSSWQVMEQLVDIANYLYQEIQEKFGPYGICLWYSIFIYVWPCSMYSCKYLTFWELSPVSQ